MALSHNSLIRGFNSIYQQAPRLSPSDHKDFICYCLAWHNCVEKHHDYEETFLFPAIEKATGVKGIMDGEVEQHATFHDGMEEFKKYLLQLNRGKSKFSHQRLLQIMDTFSKPLHDHLTSEPQSLLAVRRYSTAEKPIDLVAMALDTGKKSVTAGFVFSTLPVFLLNMETVQFEDGMWHGVFPPMTGPAKWVMTKGVPRWHQSWWRFVSCTPDGRLKHLAV
ncbi:hypothetical protein GJ744_005153 [Endocarpon pusillum]|uniref:Hemerythrin-like domain-containing protein n=1 Tax=Endocarpon pusillum TaxID=364733 RepID=A0A8H7E913_9EURO|nr:hypothetical protein GJ744_005153 [Endocarpon pusillum]